MTCEDISKKALELGLKPNDIKIIKEPFNGYRIEGNNEDKRVNELKEFVK